MKFTLGISAILFSLFVVGCGENIKLNGMVSGLSSGEFTIQIDGTTQFGEESDQLTLSANAPFVSNLMFVEDTDYFVQITSQPEGLTCVLVNSTGSVSSDASIDITCDDPSEVVEIEVIELKGIVLNLKEDLQIVNTKNGEIVNVLSGDETFTFTEEVSNADGYEIEIVDGDYDQICEVENGVATLENNNDIIIRCNLPFISLSPIGSSFLYYPEDEIKHVSELGYIEFIGRAMVDDVISYNDLQKDNFLLKENGNEISETESYPQLSPLNYYDFYYSLVILIDTSTSMSEDALEKSREAARALIQDENGMSRIHPNQEVYIVTFDDNVHPETVRGSSDLATLNAQIDAITNTSNSSSMNCPLSQASTLWSEDFVQTDVDVVERTHNGFLSYGSLVIISDGIDTSGTSQSKCLGLKYNEESNSIILAEIDRSTEEYEKWNKLFGYDRLKQYRNVFVLSNGEEYESNDFFETIAQEHNIFTVDLKEGVIDRIYQDIKQIDDNEFGLFYYSYISPNRSSAELKSNISIKFTSDSGSYSYLEASGIKTDLFRSYLPETGFGDALEYEKLETEEAAEPDAEPAA
ncbi:vWA domain-containing protein [Marinicellulosiphila megalodicopiae]|uniref:vWA domain-containing protein n=1 Tax=Marinicellulosiphila megalodicopiae TaxID=2724896 RepID=UPI003BB00B6B